jgi:rod shape-determining protein MreC
LGIVQNRAGGSLDPVSRLIQAPLKPIILSLDSAADQSNTFWSGVRDASQLRIENQKLEAELTAVRNYLDSASAQESRIRDLRGTMNLPGLGKEKVFADIIAFVPYDNRITLSAGKDKGITPNLPVVTVNGLLAIVSTVSEKTSQATLLTSSAVQVGGLVQGLAPVPGLVKGQTSQRLVMDVFDDAGLEIAPGANVVTTGYSEFIPRGIKIGTVTETFRDVDFGVRRVFILPSARIGMTKEVVILK